MANTKEPDLPEGEQTASAGLLPPLSGPPLMIQLSDETVKSLQQLKDISSNPGASPLELIAGVLVAVISWFMGSKMRGRTRTR